MAIHDTGLNDIHYAICELLSEFDRVCRLYDIKYSISFGTMLGAIRHRGFIPWDDDADVFMTRLQYTKLEKLPSSVWNSRFFFQTMETDKCYPYRDARLRLNHSSMILKSTIHSGFNQGLFIDIDVLDNIPNRFADAFFQRVIMTCFELIRRTRNRFVFLNSGNKALLPIKYILWYILHHLSTEKRYNQELSFTTHYNNKFCSRIGIIANGNLHFGNYYPKKPIPAYTMNSYVDVCFEGKTLMCSAYYNELLSLWYGDYMKPPAEKKRQSSHDIIFISSTIPYTDFLSYYKKDNPRTVC